MQQEPQAPTSDNLNITELVDKARLAALQAGQAIMEVYESDDFGVESKSDASPLTLADKAAHEIITAHLQETGLPILSEEGTQFDFEERKNWEWFWLIDPLDGTKEFINRNGEFTVNIALMYRNTPKAGVVFAPSLHALYYGSKETGVFKELEGVSKQLHSQPEQYSLDQLLTKPEITILASRSHLNKETEQFITRFSNAKIHNIGSSLKFMLLAENKADLNPRFGPTMEWDTAASHAILNVLHRGIYQIDLQSELVYNKQNLLNPPFIAF